MNKEILEKVAHFNELVFQEISSLQNKLSVLEKAAEEQEYKKDCFELAVKKAADALYESDFLTDKFEHRDFVKKATNDPGCLVKMIQRICEHRDVLSLGKTSSVRASNPEEFDPIMARAFHGYYNRSSVLLDD